MEKYIKKQGLPPNESFQKQSWMSRLKDWFYKLILQRLFPRGIFYHPGQIRILDRCSISRSPFLFLPPRQSIVDSTVIKTALKRSTKRFDINTICAFRQSEDNLEEFSISLQDHEDWIVQDLSDSRSKAWPVQQATVRGLFSSRFNILTFLENNLETDGKAVLDISLDILDHALECIYLDNFQTGDVQIVPVSVSYEICNPIWPRTFMDYVLVFLGLWPSFGSARVDFDQPFSLREFNSNWEKSVGHEDVKWNCATHTMLTCWKGIYE